VKNDDPFDNHLFWLNRWIREAKRDLRDGRRDDAQDMLALAWLRYREMQLIVRRDNFADVVEQ